MTRPEELTAAPFDVGVIGAGPAGLMAAEVIASAGLKVTVFDGSASAGRKFLLAGRGGLNLTHSEPLVQFLGRYHGGDTGAAEAIARWLADFDPAALRAWCHELGIETFVGSSGRVFPTGMKAAPLLRAWLHRLRSQGVRFAMRHRWTGWDEAGMPRLEHADQPVRLTPPRAWVLALGGGSWPHLGSDGGWMPLLHQRGVQIHDLLPSNCGFEVAVHQADGSWRAGWSEHLRSRFPGAALKNVAATVREAEWTQRGEVMLSDHGIEGNLVYAASSRLREQLLAARAAGAARAETSGAATATLWLDLLPAHPAAKVLAEVTRPRGPRSWATHLKSRLGLDGVKSALLHEILPRPSWQDESTVAAAIKALPLTVTSPRPLAEAISSAGGIAFGALTPQLELTALPGFFCAGEMLAWDAPTGGYLLTACFASGRVAGCAAVDCCRATL